MSAAAKISARLDGRPVIVVGRAGMDLYPLPDGSTIETATSFVSDVGGSAGNIAVAVARLVGGYDGWLSIEHEDVLLNSFEGLEKSVTLLQGVMPDRPANFKPQEI